MKIKSLSVLLLMVPMFIFSQTKEEREKIASFSNKESNAILAKQLHEEESARKIRVNNYLQNNPDVNKVTRDGFGKTEIMDVLPNGEILYAKTYNEGAAVTARANKLYSGGGMGLNIQGQNMIAGVWDGDNVRDTHQEFMVSGVSKITNVDGVTFGNHATHVAGTISANGILPAVRGIAFNSSIRSYNWGTDLSEMLSEASTGLLMSNHSYGSGSLGSLWFFGAYDSRAKQMDEICFFNPYYLPVLSAGNSRGETTAPATTQMNNKFGYDMIFGHANAKNVLTVAAVFGVPTYNDASSVLMSTFSSYGPSDDGRIKPEISMKGVQVGSTLSSSDTAVGYMSGTSMASPGITGVVALLQQYFHQLYGNWMKSATVKGLILHTADEAGSSPGPDYKFGWGLVNAQTAANVIKFKNTTLNGSLIEERNLTTGSTYTKTITANGINPLKVSISWTDPAAPTENTGTVDPTTKYLVNDLDLKVTSLDGTVYYPWKLQGMTNTWGDATTTSTNNVDNFERVDIDFPFGTYTISVTHKATLLNNAQNFSLIVTSDGLSSLGTNENALTNGEEIALYPNPTKDILYLSNLESSKSVISIFDMSGKMVMTKMLTEPQLNVQHLIAGNYILKILDKNQKETILKFIKK